MTTTYMTTGIIKLKAQSGKLKGVLRHAQEPSGKLKVTTILCCLVAVAMIVCGVGESWGILDGQI